jgi:hypothetical protein
MATHRAHRLAAAWGWRIRQKRDGRFEVVNRTGRPVLAPPASLDTIEQVLAGLSEAEITTVCGIPVLVVLPKRVM